MSDPTTLLPRPRGLDSLRRFSGRLPRCWPIPPTVSCAFPLYVYYRSVLGTGQIRSAYDIRYIAGVITRRARDKLGKNFSDSVYVDDFYRKMLKQVSAFAFDRTFSEGPVWMLFGHMHALTGKAPFRVEDIEEDITRWVSSRLPNGEEKDLDRQSVKDVLDSTFANWRGSEPDGSLSFLEYCDDVMRWGTSGGGPKSEIFGSRYRTKWAWGIANSLRQDGSLEGNRRLYERSLKTKQYASVALKEEAQKTRAVITAPMASYLRQSYLLYRWGKPNISSPISSPSWLAQFEKASPSWYGCVDGEKFDQTIPKWFVLEVIRRLGEIDESTREVARVELESVDKLQVEWRGRFWNYEGGILSGWRLTSLLGTLASLGAAHFILKRVRGLGGIECGALGDDLILWSSGYRIAHEDLVRLYNDFGLSANSKKTTSGRVGEFLRKTVSGGGSWGYPCLGLRTICYANPWVSSYEFDEEGELASTVLTFFSRLVPHRTSGSCLNVYIERLFVSVMTAQFGPGQWGDWFRTPSSVGGGGCAELSDPSRWVQLRKIERKQRFTSPGTIIPSLLGVLKSKIIFEPVKKFHPVSFRRVSERYREILQSPSVPDFLSFKKSTSILDTLYGVIWGSVTRAELSRRLQFPLPRSMRGMEPEDIVRALLTPAESYSPVTSITHTKETVSGVTGLVNFVARCISKSKRFASPYTLKPLITLYFEEVYARTMMPFGTW